ncbi:MAG: TatD family hydrolase [Oscillospiraceae bacterium]|nr:TatD family hydrolase [Oscillospiraceae bacterium]
MYFDTHAHYDNPRFDLDRRELLQSLPEHGVTLVLNPGFDLPSSRTAIGLAEDYPHIYAAVGFHPHDSSKFREGDLERLETLTRHPKVMAVGEIGLDYHYDHSPRDIQRLRFREQMGLARKAGLPAIVHQREAAEDTLEILRDCKDVTGVVHCFSGSVETAKVVLDLGWYISFTGVITHKNARKSHEVIQYMPRERLMLETDAPYMAPEPFRRHRNSSLYMPQIAEAVAALWGITTEEAAAITMENGKRCFRIS